MFDNSDALGNHLIHDGFFRPWDGKHDHRITDDHTLLILDDYNTSNMNNPVFRDFYTDAFRSTDVRRIIILYQTSLRWGRWLDDLAEFLDENPLTLRSFISATVKKQTRRNMVETLDQYYFNNALYRNVTAALDFIHEMRVKDIDVTYCLYENRDFDPPFHGRYWLDNNVGYIVDGSLNNYGVKKVFAQKMDDENYEIIRDLVDREVLRHARPGLTDEDFRRVFDKIERNSSTLFAQIA